MKNNQQSLTLNSAALFAAFLLNIALPAAAEDVPINDTPLFMSASVAPNVFFEVDDSGSMNWSVLTRSHWHFCTYDQRYAADTDACNWVGQITDGLWYSFYNYQQTASGSSSNSDTYHYLYDQYNDDTGYTIDNCTPLSGSDKTNCEKTNAAYADDWRILSADFNVLYYNPKVTYAPWKGPCLTDGTACDNASFAGARRNPRQGATGYSPTRPLNGFVYEVWVDDKGYQANPALGGRPQTGADRATIGANGEVDLWDKHVRYEFQNGNTVQVKTTTYAPSASSLNATTTSATLTGAGCFTELGNGTGCRTIAEAKQNIANWYQYSSNRHLVAKGAVADVVSEFTGFRYGLSVINNYSNLFVTMPAASTTSFTTHNKSLLSDLFDLAPSGYTPLRSGLDRVGKYYDNDDNRTDPIIGACQKNYTVLLTDGYWNQDSGFSIGGDLDKDGYNNTLADVAYFYYNKDLSPLDDDVPTDDFDTKKTQHMVTFGIAFGVQGSLTDTDSPKDGWPDNASGQNLTEGSDWGNPSGESETPAKIDDLWHAAYNSRGTFAAASTASEVAESLKDALENIERRQSSAAAVSMNTGLVGGDASLYQVRFDSRDWSGSLQSYPIDPDTGVVSDSSDWDASTKLPAWGSRNILTHNPATVKGGGTAFRWGSLAATQLDNLRTGLTGTAADIDAAALKRLEYLRGNDAAEERNSGTLRDRSSKLGDIVDSAPMYVSSPAFPYTNALESTTDSNNYIQFQLDHEDRTPMVYVGANDGMLHGFNADTGEEQLAYVPNAVFGNLYRLTNPNYSHRFYVDGTPTIGDAFFDPASATGSNKSWHTVLAGGLNKGGQAIYALDITNPDRFSETNAAGTVLWEFSDANDVAADASQAELDMRYALGDTFSRPAIVRLHNGQWAAVFGNGYNSTRADGYASTTGDAVLYLVDIGTGQVIRKISTQTGSAEDPEAYLGALSTPVYRNRANGLPTTAPVDVDADHIVDYVYAGDLFGNLWKFDVSSDNPADWKVAYEDDSGNPAPLFTACNGACQSGVNSTYQPITTRPEVGRSPDRYGLMVYFGTGKYLASEDITDDSVQSFYAIIDSGERITGNRSTALVEQKILSEANYTFNNGSDSYSYGLRVTSEYELGGAKGWFMDLKTGGSVAEGERVVQQPLLRDGRIIFVTLTPSSDICGFGGSSWYMELNAHNGKHPTVSAWDLNHDHKFNDLDTAGGTPASGKRHNEIITTPAILSGSGGTEYSYTSGSSGNVDMEKKNPPASAFGRQSWRQLR